MQGWEDAWLAEDAKRRDGASLFPARASDQQIADSINAFRKRVAADSASAVCAVCGEFSTDTSVWALNRADNASGAKLISKALLNNLKAVLQNCLDRPIQTASCSLADKPGLQELEGLCLQRWYYANREDSDADRKTAAGVCEAAETITLCACCEMSIKRKQLPARALANDLVFKPVPACLKGLTIAERLVVSAARLWVKLIQLQLHDKASGRDVPDKNAQDSRRPDMHFKLKGNCIAFLKTRLPSLRLGRYLPMTWRTHCL